MYKHILIATDGSELAGKAVDTALKLAKLLGSKVTAVTITEPWSASVMGEGAIAFPIEEYDDAMKSFATAALNRVESQAKELAVPAMVRHVKDQFPAEGIIEAAGEVGADLIVMASHGRRGLSRIILGSQATKVLTHSKIPVLICR